jgi:hypothetical protein
VAASSPYYFWDPAGLERFQRIKQWKHRLQKSVKAQNAWIKRAPLQSTICFDNGYGERTANVKSLFGAVRQAWQSVHELFKNGEPSATEFLTNMINLFFLDLLLSLFSLASCCAKRVFPLLLLPLVLMDGIRVIFICLHMVLLGFSILWLHCYNVLKTQAYGPLRSSQALQL